MIALHTIRQRHSKGISVQWCVTRRKDGCAAALCISGVGMQKLSLRKGLGYLDANAQPQGSSVCCQVFGDTYSAHLAVRRGRKGFGVKLCRAELVLRKTGLRRQPALQH